MMMMQRQELSSHSSSSSPELKIKMDDEKYLGSVLQSIKRRNGSSFEGSTMQC